MREGLVLISGKGEIISINKSAARIFETDAAASTGNHILSLNRSVSLQSVVEGALGGLERAGWIDSAKPALPDHGQSG